KGLVDRYEVQLHRLPPDRDWPAIRTHGIAAVSGGEQTEPSTGSDERGRARQSGMAEILLGQSLAQHHRHKPQRNSLLSPGAHADVLFVGRRNPLAGAVLPSNVKPATAVHSTEAGTDYECGEGNGAAIIHQHGGTVPEVPCNRRPGA